VTSVGAWLKSLNRFNALDRQRAKRRSKDSKAIREREAKDKTFTTGGFSLVDLRESTQAALDTLPTELRDIVVLRYWEHLSYAQIGQRLRISMPMVQRRLMEASVRLCAVLKKSGATGQFEKLPPKGDSNE
jgi:RNA polymerase sigma factor (sigma-70 family)